MDKKMFMKAPEVAQVLEISVPYAYKLIRQMNEELKRRGCMVIAGRVDRRYFYERFYSGTQLMNEEKGENKNAGV